MLRGPFLKHNSPYSQYLTQVKNMDHQPQVKSVSKSVSYLMTTFLKNVFLLIPFQKCLVPVINYPATYMSVFSCL